MIERFMKKKEKMSCLITDFIENSVLEKWSEKYAEEFPDVFKVEISLCPMKVVKISDRYETKEQLDFDNNFERVAAYTDLYVMNIEDDK